MTLSISNRETMSAHRARLMEISQRDGSELRKLFHEQVEKQRDELERPAFSVELTGRSHQFYINTAPVPKDDMDDAFKGIRPVLRVAEPGSVHGNFKIGNIPVPCGVVLIVGAANTAKTPLAMAMGAASGDYVHIRHGEPLAGYSSSQAELAQEICESIFAYPDVSSVVLDSMKDQLVTTPGAAMASGLSRLIWPMLSDLSSAFSEVGKSLIVPINPATITEGVLEMVIESAKSNVAMVVASQGENRWMTTTRAGEGLQRINSTFSHSFRPDGSLEISESNLRSSNKGGKSEIRTQGTISDDQFDSVLRRNFNHLKPGV